MSTEENKATFRRYVEEVGNEGNLDLAEKILAEGDKVVTRWRMRSTHEGEFRGIAPTGKELDVTSIGIFRFAEEGKVVESWDNFDQLGMMQQLGAISTPEQSEGATPT